MDNKINYQALTDKQIEQADMQLSKPRLLLHACCAPCSSYVLEYLKEHFDITLFFYNPNIFPKEEYDFRADELKRLINEMGLSDRVKLLVPEFDAEPFLDISKGKEHLPEKSDRCTECYSLRLSMTQKVANEGRYDFFSTTLSISPHKDADRLNSIGKKLEASGNPVWLYSDFKKKNGYKRSIELSRKYELYRQNYCGCIFSKRVSDKNN